MSNDEILPIFARIIEEVVGVDATEVTPKKFLVTDLHIDSLSMLEVVVQAEDSFGVNFPYEQLADAKTVGDAVDCIAKKIAKKTVMNTAMSGSTSKTVLLTGASGVVGTALVPELARRHRVIAMTHRRSPPGGVRTVSGDLTRPDLGMDPIVYNALAEQVDIVIHAAAVTDFAAGADATASLNIAGTENVLRFTEDAGASLHYISTAFVDRTVLTRNSPGEAAANPADYLNSKRAAERLVLDSGVPATIVRPSVVIGDSATGEIARFQGLLTLGWAVLNNTLPMLPLDPTDRIDFVPQDVLARAVASLVEADVTSGEYWITAGEAALTTQQVFDTVISTGRKLGIDIVTPRFVAPDMVDRLIRPVFIEPLPKQSRRQFDDLLAMAALFATGTTFPSSLGRGPGMPSITTEALAKAQDTSMVYMARTRGPVRSKRRAA
jgi:acyl carrier protein